MSRRSAEARGRQAELVVARALEADGWDIIAERYKAPRSQKSGEIDLIVEKGDLLRFIEVKARTDAARAAEALEAIARTGGARHMAAAEAFLAERPDIQSLDCRFDVVVVYPDDTLEWVENVFSG
ncbi:MAG: YraN family protein [Alphaproteobacteria bacterium]